MNISSEQNWLNLKTFWVYSFSPTKVGRKNNLDLVECGCCEQWDSHSIFQKVPGKYFAIDFFSILCSTTEKFRFSFRNFDWFFFSEKLWGVLLQQDFLTLEYYSVPFVFFMMNLNFTIVWIHSFCLWCLQSDKCSIFLSQLLWGEKKVCSFQSEFLAAIFLCNWVSFWVLFALCFQLSFGSMFEICFY